MSGIDRIFYVHRYNPSDTSYANFLKIYRAMKKSGLSIERVRCSSAIEDESVYLDRIRDQVIMTPKTYRFFMEGYNRYINLELYKVLNH